MGYPLLMLRYLPAGVLGIVVASFVAAFMSTVSTQINWGASYLVNDLYARFVNPEASQKRLVALGRLDPGVGRDVADHDLDVHPAFTVGRAEVVDRMNDLPHAIGRRIFLRDLDLRGGYQEVFRQPAKAAATAVAVAVVTSPGIMKLWLSRYFPILVVPVWSKETAASTVP